MSLNTEVIKNQVLINSDVIDALSEIKDNTVDLVFIDPPYNIGKKFDKCSDNWTSDDKYIEWCYTWLTLCINKLKDNGSMYFMSSTKFMPYFDLFISQKMKILSRIIWAYDSSSVQAKKFYGSMYEPILFCVKNDKDYLFNSDDILIEAKTGSKRKLIDYRKHPPKPYSTTKVPGNVWNFSRVRYRMKEYENHPTQKPIALLERIIKASSNVDDIILDPFAGSFTTAAVSLKLHRNSINIENSETYYQAGIKRLLKL